MPTVAVGGMQLLTCHNCGRDWERPTVRGSRPRHCPECPAFREGVREKKRAARTVQVLTCERCGFNWEWPETPGRGPRHCTECRPIVAAERQVHWRAVRRLPRDRTKVRPGRRGRPWRFDEVEEAQLWRHRLARAGLQPERTEAEWVAHPTALEDLMRVMAGTALATINAERQLAKKAA